jgi:hypothetical protein
VSSEALLFICFENLAIQFQEKDNYPWLEYFVFFVLIFQRVKKDMVREEYRKTFSSMLQLLLYLCSEEPDMPQIEHPQKRRTFSGGVRSPKEPQVWDVGVRVSNAIRNYKNHERSAEKEMPSVQGAHSSPRPHVRAAHWHTFWVGPRSAKFPDRKPIIRWLPPIPIGIDWKRELPTNIHMVLES